MIRAAGYLLAGGQSSRMGRDKALLELDGITLVERGVAKLTQVCEDVALLGNDPALQRFGRVVADAVPGCGPLGGIVAALEDTKFGWNFVLAVDVPFLPAEALVRLLTVAETSGAMAVIAEADGTPQPLCAVYAAAALPVLREALLAGQWKVMAAIRAAGPVVMLPFAEVAWFRNLNTPEEFAAAVGNG